MNDHPEIWAPLKRMPDGAENWGSRYHDDLILEWNEHVQAMKALPEGQRFMDAWLRERVRAFAIETGQIEGLYTLRRGVTEQLIAEGFGSAVGGHAFEDMEDETLKGLLEDQEAAYDMMFDDVASGRPLSAWMIKSWHQMLVRHQRFVVGRDMMGRLVQIPFERKGVWKVMPNNPTRDDGVVHQYCPPEHVDSEIERLLTIHRDEVAGRYPVNVEAAWLHHRFVRTHPFQDGNGRVSRLLMAWPYVKRHLPPPVIEAKEKPGYFDALAYADRGDLKEFSDYIDVTALVTLRWAVMLARSARDGRLHRNGANGGTVHIDQPVRPRRNGEGHGVGSE